MSNPYYIGSAANYTPNFMGQPQNNNFVQPYTNSMQPINNFMNNSYDFIGRYVKSYDEVKNAPFEEKTCIYLDTEHDRIYIKEISHDGVPKVNVLGLQDIQNITQPTIQEQIAQPAITLADIDAKNEQVLQEISNKFEKRIKALEDKVQKNF